MDTKDEDELLEALILTTTALARSREPGAEFRVNESNAVLAKYGIKIAEGEYWNTPDRIAAPAVAGGDSPPGSDSQESPAAGHSRELQPSEFDKARARYIVKMRRKPGAGQ